MTRSWLTSDLGAQPAVLAVDARDLLPRDHMVFGLIEQIRQVDMFAFEAAYRSDGAGRPPYDPRMLLTLLCYCRAKGITSARAVAAACVDDLGARLIMANQRPGRSTIDRFITMHKEAIRAALAQTLRLADKVGLIDLSVVAGDGTVIDANASMSATIGTPDLRALTKRLRAEIDAVERQWLAEAGAQAEALLGEAERILPAADQHSKTWQRWKSLRGRLTSAERAEEWLRENPGTDTRDWQERVERDLKRVQTVQARLDAEYALACQRVAQRQELAAQGKGVPGSKGPATPEKYKRVLLEQKNLATAKARAEATAAKPPAEWVNLTDPVSRIMPSKHGEGFAQRHNMQALSCPGQLILAVTTHNSPNDKRAMVNLLKAGRANLDAAGITDPIGTALFDCGYASTANFTAETPVDKLLIAVEKEARQTGRLKDNTSTAHQAWEEMEKRLSDPTNMKLYKRRGAIIEPTFAQLFARDGNDIAYRDEDVLTETRLRAITHNLLKIITQKRRKP